MTTGTWDNIGGRVPEGFWQTNTATKGEGWPEDTNSWYHLMSVTHATESNYYALQMAGAYFDNQNFFVRKVGGDLNAGYGTPWRKLWHDGNMTKSVLNVGDFGGYPGAPSAVNTAAIKAAYDASPPRGRIVFSPGVWDYDRGQITGDKPVMWQIDGAISPWGAPVDLPGIREGLFEFRHLIQKNAFPGDQQAALEIQTTGAVGGVGGASVGVGFASSYTAPAGQNHGNWSILGVMDSYSNLGPSAQNCAMELVSRQFTFDGTTVYGMAVEAGEYHRQPNPNTYLTGAEIAIVANGGDANNKRTILFLPAQKRFEDDPAHAEVAHGIYMAGNQGTTTIKTGFRFDGEYNFMIRAGGEDGRTVHSNVASIDLVQDTGATALAMHPDQALRWWDPARGVSVARMTFDTSGAMRFDDINLRPGGQGTPGSVGAWMRVNVGGTEFLMPLFYPSQVP